MHKPPSRIPMSTRTTFIYAAVVVLLPMIGLIFLALDGKYTAVDKLKVIGWIALIIVVLSFLVVTIDTIF